MYNESLANKDLANTDFSKTLTRSDEKSCTKNLANTDLANTDIFKIVIESDESHNHFSFYSINSVLRPIDIQADTNISKRRNHLVQIIAHFVPRFSKSVDK